MCYKWYVIEGLDTHIMLKIRARKKSIFLKNHGFLTFDLNRILDLN